MPKVALTDRFCATAKPFKGQRVDYFDEKVLGLALRVTEHGHRSWCFHFRAPGDGKRARATIGSYPSTSLAAARGKVLEARGHVEAGKDPRLILAGQGTAGMTVAGLVEQYLADPERARLRSKAEIERRLRQNVLPLIGAVKLSELRRRDVRNAVDPLLRRGHRAAARRVHGDILAAVRWALRNEFIESNPIADMTKPMAGMPRKRILSDDEIQILWNGLPDALAKSPACQKVLKFCLVTGQRLGEVAGMRRSELNLKAGEWKLPGERTKNTHEHVVPLSDLAVALIKEAMADAGKGDWVFPYGHGSLRAVTVSREVFLGNERELFGIAHWTAHDLRRTALTQMAQLGVLPIVLGHIANHLTTTQAGITLGIYVQHPYQQEKRQALDLWAERLKGIVGGSSAKVIAMARP